MHRFTVIFMVFMAAACGSSATNNSGSSGSSANENRSQVETHANHKMTEQDVASHSADHGHAMESSPGAESAPLELQFLDSMIAHHKGAVDMAMLAETRASRAEIKELAANIINDQEREMARMSEWRDQWFGEKPDAINMKFPGMAAGMGGMDMKRLESKAGTDFDVEFIRQMIPHHEGAIEMAKAIRSAARPELKLLGDDIIAAQEAEIRQMREWLTMWTKP